MTKAIENSTATLDKMRAFLEDSFFSHISKDELFKQQELNSIHKTAEEP